MLVVRKYVDGWINIIDRFSKNLMMNKDFLLSSNYVCIFYI